MTDAPPLDRPTLAWLQLASEVDDDEAPYTPNPDRGLLGPDSRDEATALRRQIAEISQEIGNASTGSASTGTGQASAWGPPELTVQWLLSAPYNLREEARAKAYRHDAACAPEASLLAAVAREAPSNAPELVRAYVELGGPAVAPLIAPLLDHPEWAPRRAAVDAAGALGDLTVLARLRQILTADTEPFVRKSAAIALGQLAAAHASVNADVRQVLASAMERDEAKGVRLAAERALARLDG